MTKGVVNADLSAKYLTENPIGSTNSTIATDDNSKDFITLRQYLRL